MSPKHIALDKGSELIVTINQISVSYSDEGPVAAPMVPIVFIHGFPFDKHMWQEQIELLKNDFRVLAYDVRGHGQSQLGDELISINVLAADFIKFLDTLCIDQCIVCGLSMGGYIAMRAQVDHPQRFKALVLCDTQCAADTEEVIASRNKAIAQMKEGSTTEFINATINNLFATESFSTKLPEIDLIRTVMTNTATETLISTLNAFSAREECCSTLGNIAAPVLIMVGSEDKITPPKCSRLMQSKIANSKMVTIPFSGHLPNIENSDEFNSHLLRFVRDVVEAKQPFSFVDSGQTKAII